MAIASTSPKRLLLTVTCFVLALAAVLYLTCTSSANESMGSSHLAYMPPLQQEPIVFNDMSAAAEKGKQLYLMHCSPCHQTEGQGKVGLAPSIKNKDFLLLASDAFIEKTVLEGRAMTTMIPRPDLKGESLDNIIAYLRDGNPGNDKVITDDKKVYKGDAVKGAVGFKTYCAACHGPKGEGYFAGGPGPGIGLASFLNNASDDYIFQTLKRGRVGTAMKAMIGAKGVANLDDQEAIDIIAYLRSLHK